MQVEPVHHGSGQRGGHGGVSPQPRRQHRAPGLRRQDRPARRRLAGLHRHCAGENICDGVKNICVDLKNISGVTSERRGREQRGQRAAVCAAVCVLAGAPRHSGHSAHSRGQCEPPVRPGAGVQSYVLLWLLCLSL